MPIITSNPPIFGCVVIGRNEGQRLVQCIESIQNSCENIVYVDSGSTDNSVEYCRSQSVHVVELDLTIPFTAARARNAGYQALLSLRPEIEFIQFIDGDCRVDPHWVPNALDFLLENKEYAAVAGRRKEAQPDNSIYNTLCDIEWNTPIGDCLSFGGDVMIRASALIDVAGYRESVIAGEEPELCFRLRKNGWKIYRIDHDMTIHDAAITKMSQWWKRAKRSGYAYAKGALLHGRSAEYFCVKSSLSILFWGACLPALIVATTFIFNGWIGLIVSLIYPAQYIKLVLKGPADRKINRWWAFYLLLGKLPECTGIFSCLSKEILSKEERIIEYK